MADIKRIADEMDKLKNSNYASIRKTERINNNDLEWKVVFDGPEETAYEYGIFSLKFIFPNDYPTHGPEGIFITPMFHPNVRVPDQHICINLLNNWEPNRTIEEVIVGILDIMINPHVEGAYGNEACTLLGEDKDKYYDKVEEFTFSYAQNEC